MAEDIENTKNTEDAEATGSGVNKKFIIILAVVTIFAIGSSVGITMVMIGDDQAAEEVAEVAEVEDPDEEPAAEAAPARDLIYIDLAPPFVVNFQDKDQHSKYLKAELSVVTGEEDVEEAVTKHMPAIRNNLVLLFSRQIYDDLLPHEGKERLRAEALAEVQGVLEAQIGSPGVEDLYFSSLVMQ